MWASIILALCETLVRLFGLEDVTKASIDIVLRSKWVSFHFQVIPPFNGMTCVTETLPYTDANSHLQENMCMV